ncbi:MAG: hypothetical protein JW724_04355 [Candidatus Altiarchaeota archaeon]|nr:hypothetical protein [Candidatus Altiarchaeota archaeon]
MNTISRSFKLVGESFKVLKKDKEIMLFPVISAVVSLALLAFFLVSVFSAGFLGDLGDYMYYPLVFVYYLLSYLIVIFFNTGLVTCAGIRMNGGDPKFRDGIDNALKHFGKIFSWALLAATVGIILNALSRRSGLLGRIIISIIGMAWSLLTFFVVPVLIFENYSVTESIKRSGALFRKTWGENFVGQFSIGMVFVLLGILGIFPIILGLLSGSIELLLILAGLALFYWVMLAIISSSLSGVFLTALYIYATTGSVPKDFSEETIKGAYRPKSGIKV